MDGQTSWFSVTCWRGLADNVRDSVRKGDLVFASAAAHRRVGARGRPDLGDLRVEATTVGYDLTCGTGSFLRSTRPERVDTEEEINAVLKEWSCTTSRATRRSLDSLGRNVETGRVA